MTAQPASIMQQKILPSLDKDLILKGLEQTQQLRYFTLVGGRHGFAATTRWQSTLESIEAQLATPSLAAPYATLSNLYLITLKIITGANHYYAIDTLNDGSETNKIPSLLTLMSEPGRQNEFTQVFPSKLTQADGLPSYAGHHLSAVEKMTDGIALIFAHVLIKKISKGSIYAGTTYPEQYFNTVFIPNDMSRIEYRVDRDLGSRGANKAINELRQEFMSLIVGKGIKLNLNTINFYKAINNAYKDKNYGRVVQADAVDAIGDEDANFRCRTNATYDARFRKVVKTDTGKNVDLSVEYYCVYVRFDYTTNKESHHNEIGFETTRQNYISKKFCGSFFMVQQSDNVPHFGVINDILNRAK